MYTGSHPGSNPRFYIDHKNHKVPVRGFSGVLCFASTYEMCLAYFGILMINALL